MSEMRQFKLATGEEIICEVLEWNDDSTDLIVVRNVLEIQYIVKETFRMCTMRPYMLQQIQNEYFQTLNAMHITMDAKPAEETIASWQETCSYFLPTEEEEQTEVEEITEEEAEQILNNVLDFSKKKLH